MITYKPLITALFLCFWMVHAFFEAICSHYLNLFLTAEFVVKNNITYDAVQKNPQ